MGREHLVCDRDKVKLRVQNAGKEVLEDRCSREKKDVRVEQDLVCLRGREGQKKTHEEGGLYLRQKPKRRKKKRRASTVKKKKSRTHKTNFKEVFHRKQESGGRKSTVEASPR